MPLTSAAAPDDESKTQLRTLLTRKGNDAWAAVNILVRFRSLATEPADQGLPDTQDTH